MEKVNSNWKIWGIVSIVVIGFLFIFLAGSFNAVMQLKEMNENCFVCYDGDVGYCMEEGEAPIVCPKNTKAACMYPEDYKEYYGM